MSEGRLWDYLILGAGPQAMAEAVIERIKRSSALSQQFGLLADVLAVPGDGGPTRYYEEVPLAYAHKKLDKPEAPAKGRSTSPKRQRELLSPLFTPRIYWSRSQPFRTDTWEAPMRTDPSDVPMIEPLAYFLT